MSPGDGGSHNQQPQGEIVVSNETADNSNRRCFKCHKVGHISKDCQAESDGRERRDKSGTTNQVQSHSDVADTGIKGPAKEDLQKFNVDELFYSSDDENSIQQVRVPDKGSKPRRAVVQIQGVPASGIIDSGADITYSLQASSCYCQAAQKELQEG